jgi:hypothetical protein
MPESPEQVAASEYQQHAEQQLFEFFEDGREFVE